MNGEVPGVAKPFGQIGPHILLTHNLHQFFDVVHKLSLHGMVERWNIGMMGQTKKDHYSL